MKNMLKKLISLGLLTFAGSCFAQSAIDSAFNLSNTGTTSSTVVIPAGSGYAQITDLAWRLDSGVSTGTVGIRAGSNRFAVSSATSASGTAVWFSNLNTGVATGQYVIYYNAAAGSYTLLRAKAAATTSITTVETITPATTTSDYVWSTLATVEKPVPNTNTATVTTGPNIWLPKNTPVALTIDGNTTACRISVSGVRTLYK